MAEGFRGAVQFLDTIGVYDVLLPFLLVFTIVFALLEKTKILGVEPYGDGNVTKKNLNAMVAVGFSFLVVASAQLVSVINEVIANVVLLLIVGVCFLLLIGTFHKDGEFSLDKHPAAMRAAMVVMGLGIAFIFINALGWWDWIINVVENFDKDWAAALIMIAITVGFILLITSSPNRRAQKEE